MDTNIKIELIKILPSLIWAIISIILIAIFYKPIRYELVPRITQLKLFGVEATFIKSELDKAAEKFPVGTEASRSQVARRAQRIASIIKGAHILLVDDAPVKMHVVISILKSLDVDVDIAVSTDEALSVMEKNYYDVVISDMRRGDVGDEGLRFLKETVRLDYNRPTIFAVAQYEPERGVPAYAFGITNRLDEVINLVFDVLERERG